MYLKLFLKSNNSMIIKFVYTLLPDVPSMSKKNISSRYDVHTI